MHLADAFIQATYIAFKLQFYSFISSCFLLGIEPMILAFASAMLYHLSYRKHDMNYALDVSSP